MTDSHEHDRGVSESTLTGRARTLRIEVRADGRPVAGARVLVAGRRATTTARGIATLRVGFELPGRRLVLATHADLLRGSTSIVVRRRPRFTG